LIIKSLLEAVPKPNLIMLKLKVFTFTEMRKRSSPPYEGGVWGWLDQYFILHKSMKNEPDLFEPPLPSEASAQADLSPLL